MSVTTRKAYRRQIRRTMFGALELAHRAERQADELGDDGQIASSLALRSSARLARDAARRARVALDNLGGDPDRQEG